MAGKLGVDPQQLENAALERELRCLYATRAETFVHGSRQARVNHTKRIPQLEQQYASRSPIGPGPTACDPARSPSSGRANRSGCNPETGVIEVAALPTEPRVADNPRASQLRSMRLLPSAVKAAKHARRGRIGCSRQRCRRKTYGLDACLLAVVGFANGAESS
jgi:hypothetical protein